MIKMVTKPRTFEHFPADSKCPVCNTSEDAECVLLRIDGTVKDGLCEGIPTHLWCAVATYYSKDLRMLYKRVKF